MKHLGPIAPLIKKKPKPKVVKPRDPKVVKFEALCAKYGHTPHCIRRRIAPKHDRGGGLTLKQALRTPTRTRTEAGRLRAKESPWSYEKAQRAHELNKHRDARKVGGRHGS